MIRLLYLEGEEKISYYCTSKESAYKLLKYHISWYNRFIFAMQSIGLMTGSILGLIVVYVICISQRIKRRKAKDNFFFICFEQIN
jgi:hypothetical protein